MARVLMVLLPLIASTGLRGQSPACPTSCRCPGWSVLNCSSADLGAMPQIRDSVEHLDVSHNRLEGMRLLRRTLPELRSLRLANNSIARLSLCNHGRVRGRGCASWAPNLQLLSAERNQLRRLPRGLSALEVLEILQLSFNSITMIQLGELDDLRGLRELHLRNNLISSLHPQTFRHLHQLKILDVSFNMLTSLHPSTYLSLRTIGADVQLPGNRWHCDCSMRSIRRWLALDRSRGSQSWDLVCASPPILAGADFLSLEDDDLNCSSAEMEPQFHQDVTVQMGSEVLLSCTTEGVLWWTPAGLAQANQPQSGLLISAVTEKNIGIYLCLSKDYQVMSVIHLRIGGFSRKVRSVPEGIAGEVRVQNVTHSDFVLAVCLSVFITFLVAFILGVLLRPCIEKLWKRITRKKTSNPASTAEERQYDNEAYSENEDPEELRPRRERRVTFSTVDFSEENHVKYYDTEHERKANGTAVECERFVGDSGSEKSLDQSGSEDTNGLSSQNLKRRSSSDSSLSDRDQKDVDTLQQNSTDLPQISNRKVPGFSSEHTADWIPHPNGSKMLTTEPEDDEEQFDFSDSVRSTSPKTSSPIVSYKYTRQIAPRLNRNDSSSSNSYMSDDELTQYTVNPDPREEEEVSRSYSKTNIKSAKEYEPTLDQDTELWWPKVNLEHSIRVQRRMDIKVHDGDGQARTRLGVTAAVTPSNTFYSSDSEEEEIRHSVTVLPTLDTQAQWPIHDFEHTTSAHRRTDIKRTSDSLSSTDSEDGSILLTERPEKLVKAKVQDQDVWQEIDTRWPTIDHHIPRIERPINVEPTLTDPSSSSDSEEVTRASKAQPQSQLLPRYDPQTQWPSIDLEDSFRMKRRLDVKPLSPTSGSTPITDSEDETMPYMQKQEQETIKVTKYPIKAPPTLNYDPQSKWPSIDLDDSFRLKMRLNVTAPSATSESLFRSDSDHGTTHYIPKQKQEAIKVTTHPIEALPKPGYDPQTRWPSIDLDDSFRIKRRLNVKPHSESTNSSSNSNGEHETTHQIMKKEKGGTKVTTYPTKASPTPSYDPQTPWSPIELEDSFSDSDDEMTNRITKLEQGAITRARYPIKALPTQSYDPQLHWPSIDLDDSFKIKRRLNVKIPSPPSESSSGSDSEHETIHHITKQEQVTIKSARYPTKVSPTPSYDPQAPWPSIDFDDSFKIKRRLNVRTPAPSDSLSSSDSKHETIHHVTKQEQVTTKGTRYPSKVSPTPSYEPQAPWPSIDLDDSFRIKRRLNVKTKSPPSHSLSGNHSEHETIHYVTRQEQNANKVTSYTNVSPTASYDSKPIWPRADLEDTFSIKRRLDIKPMSPTFDALSSSDSKQEIFYQPTKQEQEITKVTRYPIKATSTSRYDPQQSWPSVQLDYIFRIKRRLSIKVLSPSSHSLSNSNSKHKMQEVTNVIRYPIKVPQTQEYNPEAPWPSLHLNDLFRIKRRLDFKAPSPISDLLSSSKSEAETMYYKQKQEQGTTKITSSPVKASPLPSYAPQSPWPSLDVEDCFRIKRRLNINAPSPPSDSLSSSEPGYKMIHHITKQDQVTRNTMHPIKVSPRPSSDLQSPWPSLDFRDFVRIKKRLDFKVLSPTSHSPSSSIEQEQGTINVAKCPTTERATAGHDPQELWSSLDLVDDSFKIKRRLEIKAPSPALSSSSDSEKDTIADVQKQGYYETLKGMSPTEHSNHHDLETERPIVNFHRIKRLNIKAPSPPSSTSEDETSQYPRSLQHGLSGESESNTIVLSGGSMALNTASQDQEASTRRNPRLKRRLDIKAQLPPPVRTSPIDSMIALSHVEPAGETSWPVVDFARGTRVRWRLDIKEVPADLSHGVKQEHAVEENLPSSSDEQDNANADVMETQTLPRVNLGVSRRLDIRAPSPQQQFAPDVTSAEAWHSKSNDFTSDSGDQNRNGKASPKLVDKSSVKSPVITVPQSPKRDPEIRLEKYAIVPETAEDKPRNTTTEINPELQSRWANMHLGFSRFRKRLEITSHARETPVVSFSESDTGAKNQKQTVVGWQEIKDTESPLSTVQVYENVDKPAGDPTSGGKSSLIGMPHIKRYLDIKAPATLQQHRDSSSSSENEVESTKYSQWKGESHDLSLSSPSTTWTVETQMTTEKSQGTTAPEQSSSNNSENEPGEVEEASEMMEIARKSDTPDSESPIQYTRVIMKASSRPNDTSTNDKHTDVTTTLHGSSFSTRYQLPSLASKNIPNPRSGDDLSPTWDNHGSSYIARYPLPYSSKYQNPSFAQKTIPDPGSAAHSPPNRNPPGMNMMTTLSNSSYSTRYQIPSLAPRPFRSSTEGPSSEIQWTGLKTRLSDLSKHPDTSLQSPREGLQSTPAGSFTQKVVQEKESKPITRPLHSSSGSLSSFTTGEIRKDASEKRERRGLSALKAMSSERETWDREDKKVNSFQPSGASGTFNRDRSASTAEDLSYDIPQYRTHALPLREIPPPVPTTPLPDEAVELKWHSESSRNPAISQV